MGHVINFLLNGLIYLTCLDLILLVLACLVKMIFFRKSSQTDKWERTFTYAYHVHPFAEPSYFSVTAHTQKEANQLATVEYTEMFNRHETVTTTFNLVSPTPMPIP